VVRRSSACARTGRARNGPVDRAARLGRGTARATRGAREEFKAPQGAASGETRGTRPACGLGVRGGADAEAARAQARRRSAERIRPILFC
jgi:hypothetical protein